MEAAIPTAASQMVFALRCPGVPGLPLGPDGLPPERHRPASLAPALADCSKRPSGLPHLDAFDPFAREGFRIGGGLLLRRCWRRRRERERRGAGESRESREKRDTEPGLAAR